MVLEAFSKTVINGNLSRHEYLQINLTEVLFRLSQLMWLEIWEHPRVIYIYIIIGFLTNQLIAAAIFCSWQLFEGSRFRNAVLCDLRRLSKQGSFIYEYHEASFAKSPLAEVDLRWHRILVQLLYGIITGIRIPYGLLTNLTFKKWTYIVKTTF